MKVENMLKQFLKKGIPDIRPGDTVKVYQKFKDKDKEKIQIFEGLVIARKHGKEIGATITVRKVIGGVGVERIFPIHLPTIDKIEILKRSKVRRAKLYYLREAKGKRARLKRIEIKPTKKNKLDDRVEVKEEKKAEEEPKVEKKPEVKMEEKEEKPKGEIKETQKERREEESK